MVKGVNKTVIEVNQTGSKVFDRIVFYVRADYGNLTPRQLSRAVNSFAFQFEDRKNKRQTSLRRRLIIRRRVVLSLIAAGLVSAGILLVILL